MGVCARLSTRVGDCMGLYAESPGEVGRSMWVEEEVVVMDGRWRCIRLLDTLRRTIRIDVSVIEFWVMG